MTYSASHLVPRTPSARTLAVAAAITISALTASGLTALAERSHTRSSVTPAGVAAHTDPSVDLRDALYPFSTTSPVNPSATGLFP